MDNETLNTLITVLATGFVTLLAVHLTNRANYKKLILQTELDRDIKTKEIIQGKLEELYLLADTWITANKTNWLPYHKVMLGELTYNQALDITIQQSENNKYEFSRIKMLIDLYFSSVLKEYNELLKAQNSVNQILDAHKRDYKKGNIDGLKYVEPFLAEQKNYAEKAEILMQSITGLSKTV